MIFKSAGWINWGIGVAAIIVADFVLVYFGSSLFGDRLTAGDAGIATILLLLAFSLITVWHAIARFASYYVTRGSVSDSLAQALKAAGFTPRFEVYSDAASYFESIVNDEDADIALRIKAAQQHAQIRYPLNTGRIFEGLRVIALYERALKKL